MIKIKGMFPSALIGRGDGAGDGAVVVAVMFAMDVIRSSLCSRIACPQISLNPQCLADLNKHSIHNKEVYFVIYTYIT